MSLNSSWNSAHGALEAAVGGWVLVCEVKLLVCGFKGLLYLTNALRSRLYKAFSGACWVPGPIPDPEGGSGHGLEQVVPAWEGKALGTTLPVWLTVHLLCQLDWIFSYTGDMPLGVIAHEGLSKET